MRRSGWIIAAASLALIVLRSPSAAAECLGAPEMMVRPASTSTEEASGILRSDRVGRVVAPIMVNGQGPFRFVIDTGANRSAISQALADRLGLAADGAGDVHTIEGVSTAPLVSVESLRYERLTLNSAALPMLHSAVLGGEDGLLGVDGMIGRRLTMDFERDCIEITPSRGAARLVGWSSARGRLRFGNLVLIEGRIRARTVNVLVDTGSAVTLANSALRDRLRTTVRTSMTLSERARAYTAGTPLVLDSAVLIPRVQLGDIQAQSVLAYVGDFHVFDLWGLANEPTLLVGMDVLSQARGIAIDYERGIVYFRLNAEVRTGSRVAGRVSSTTTSIVR